MNNKQKLVEFSYNEYSQFGEDGIIDKIISIIGEGNKTCVEFGAWNGVYDANTAKLWLEKGWKTLLIEGDSSKFDVLKENTKGYDCLCVNAYVTPKGENSLDEIFRNNQIEKIDILSIDIDGDDYYIFKNLEAKPRVIICEYNPTIPQDMEMLGKVGTSFGCSSASLVKLANKKGYKLVAITDTNCIFVRNDLFEKFNDFNTDYNEICVNRHLSNLITDYKGNYFFSKRPAYGFIKPLNKEVLTEEGVAFKDLFFVEDKESTLIKLLKKIKNHPFAQTIISLGKNKKKKELHLVKVNHIKNQQKHHNCHTLIETGTYLGDTIHEVKNSFKKIYSIELSKELFRKAKKRFSNTPRIFLFNGDSGKLLGDVIRKTNKENILFWLDGHYSGGITQKGETDTPIIQELKAIMESGCKNSIILIDDASDFNGTNGYPTIEAIKDLLGNTASELKVINNIITITYNGYDQ
ncbi:FkbM family methyltransferase [Patescibacteria group bacterium]|nr:FkbM family methyltransferase [Patescibacteria group bacterium]